MAKRGDLHARRQVLAFVTEEEVVKNYLIILLQSTLKEMVDTLEYMKMGPRRGDGAEIVILELV